MSRTNDPTLPFDLAALSLQTEAASNTQQTSTGTEVLAQIIATKKAILDPQRGISEYADTISIVPGRFGAYRRRE